MDRTPKSMLMAVVLWVVILGSMAAAIRYFALPKYRAKKSLELASQTGSEGKYRITVRCAADSFSGYCTLRSPDMADRLGRMGTKFQVVDDGADYKGRIRALRAGDVDMAVFPINSFIQCGVELGEFPASIIYIIDETVGADAIVAYKDAVPTIGDLNSPKSGIVLTPDSPSEFLGRVMIASFNLPVLAGKKWIIEAKGSSDVYAKFRGDTRKEPLAYAMWEPDVSRALKDPKAHVLLDSSKIKGYIVDVLVARREFLVDHYDVARSVLEEYARTAYADRNRMVDAVVADAKAGGEAMTREDAAQLVKGIQWKNTLENYTHFGISQEANSLENIEDIIIKITDVLVKTDALESDPLSDKANSLYFNKLVRDMKLKGFHPGREINVVSGMDVGATTETVRESKALAVLSDGEWGTLTPVGELRVKPIQFGRGTARVSLQSGHELAELAKTLSSWPQYYLTVTGRVRSGGDTAAAMALAEERAKAVVQALTASGVSETRIRSRAEIAASDNAEDQAVSFVVGQRPY